MRPYVADRAAFALVSTLHLKIDGKDYTVEVDLSTSPARVTVNGKAFQVEVAGRTPGPTGRSGPSTNPGPRTQVHAGEPQPALPHIPETTERAKPSADGGVIRAPMPAKVLRVLVKAGDRVSQRQEVVVLEAMKMEQSLRSAADGVVKAVHVQAGQSVSVGQALVELAPAPRLRGDEGGQG